jgi:signal transduction histidine kinase
MTDPTENRNEVLSVENTDRLRDSHDAAMRIADCSTETAVYGAIIEVARGEFDSVDAFAVVRRDDNWLVIDRRESRSGLAPNPVTGNRLTPVVECGETLVFESDPDGEDATDFDRTLCVPVSGDAVLEIVGLPAEPDDEDVQRAELLGSLAAVRLAKLDASEAVDTTEPRLADLVEFQRELLEEATHQLRTPLTTVIGYAEVLAEGNVDSLTDDQRDLARLVLKKASKMELTIEMLQLAFEAPPSGAGRDESSDRVLVGRTDLDVDSGPLLLVEPDAELAQALADQLRNRVYQVVQAATTAAAEERLREETAAAIVVELFGSDDCGQSFMEWLRETDRLLDVPVEFLSVIREGPQGLPQLGVSAYLGDDADSLVEVAATLLNPEVAVHPRVLIFDATSGDADPVELPSSWDVTVVEDVDDEACREERDLAVVYTDELTDGVEQAVTVLRKRHHRRRMPVVLVDTNRGEPKPIFTIGSRQFVQQSIDIADLASALVSERGNAEQTGDSTTERRDRYS